MPRNQFTVCDVCGQDIKQGWAFQNHRKICFAVREYITIDDHMEAACAQYVANVADYELVPSFTVEGQLSSSKTIDSAHIVRYLGWGRLSMSDTELECCRFLRSIEVGGGSSDGSARASLDYAHTLGGRADLLPTTVRTCWAKVLQVYIMQSLSYSFYIHHHVHYIYA